MRTAMLPVAVGQAIVTLAAVAFAAAFVLDS